MRLIVVIRRPPGWYDRARTRWLARRGEVAAIDVASAAVVSPRRLRVGDFDILLF